LAATQTVTLTYTVQVKDAQNAVSSQTVAVTVTGTDDPSNTLISSVASSQQGSNNTPSTVTITFAPGSTIHTNFANLSDVMHVSLNPGSTIINGSGSFTSPNVY